MTPDSGTVFFKPMKVETPIDILVPTHNRLELTIRSINAIYENTQAPFHLIIVDDSTDVITPTYFEQLQKSHENITYIHSEEPYKEGNQLFNVGFAAAKSKYVATVMNSLTVEPDWEIVALSILENDPKVGIVGLKSLFPNGRIESAGITMLKYTPVDIGRDLAGHRQMAIYECPAVQWAFAIVRREAALGNMPENVYHGFKGWDDIDLCFGLRDKGWKIVYCGYGAGYHYPRATRGSDTQESHEKNLENARIFYKRWGYWDMFKKDKGERNPNTPVFIPIEEVRSGVPKRRKRK